MRQGDKVVEQAETQTHRQQRRLVTTTEIDGGATVAALVRYPEATQHVLAAQDATELRKLTAPADPQPVQGKAYRCRRNGEKLEITDADGNIPPFDEFKIVSQNMDALGRPNPLADFLGGHTVHVGDKLSLPHEVAERLLGLGDDLGQVSRFELVLTDVKTVGGAECGVFSASIDAASTNASQMRMQVDGSVVIQAGTCRAIEADLRGPAWHERNARQPHREISAHRHRPHLGQDRDDLSRRRTLTAQRCCHQQHAAIQLLLIPVSCAASVVCTGARRAGNAASLPIAKPRANHSRRNGTRGDAGMFLL